MKRYEIRCTAFDPTVGAKVRKTRPAVIVSLDEMNRHLQTVAACPLTRRLHPTWRSRLQVRCDGGPADVAVDQIRTVSKARLGDRIGIDPDVRFGKPCVAGTRVTAAEVLESLAGDRDEAQLRQDFPQLTHEDVLASLEFAARRKTRTVIAGF
jgi:mRNA interferase MazF